MKVTIPDPAPALQNNPRTLAIDVGCTGLKASVLDQVDKNSDRPDSCRHTLSVSAESPESPRTAIAGARVIEFGRSRQIAALHGDYDARHVVARTS